ncbi:MAG: TetR/AcrR family transcriptional regulator [Propionibacteriaceae bacterium]
MMTRQDWITRGLEALAEGGLPSVRIDRLAAELGVSKGSFHHHFAGAAAYRRELLQSYEDQALTAFHAVGGSGQGLALLEALLDSLDELYDARIEAAIRAWAMHDEDAKQVIDRLDRERLRFLTDIWGTALPDPGQARIAALLPHLVTIGASVSSATVSPEDLRSALRLLLLQVPTVPQALDPDMGH